MTASFGIDFWRRGLSRRRDLCSRVHQRRAKVLRAREGQNMRPDTSKHGGRGRQNVGLDPDADGERHSPRPGFGNFVGTRGRRACGRPDRGPTHPGCSALTTGSPPAPGQSTKRWPDGRLVSMIPVIPATLSWTVSGASAPPMAVLTQPGAQMVNTASGRSPTLFATKLRVSELSAALLARESSTLPRDRRQPSPCSWTLKASVPTVSNKWDTDARGGLSYGVRVHGARRPPGVGMSADRCLLAGPAPPRRSLEEISVAASAQDFALTLT